MEPSAPRGRTARAVHHRLLVGRQGPAIANLRRHFEVHIAHVAIAVLAAEEKMTRKDVARAIKQCRIDAEKINPLGARVFGGK